MKETKFKVYQLEPGDVVEWYNGVELEIGEIISTKDPEYIRVFFAANVSISAILKLSEDITIVA